jgi:hypothetical protein
MGFLNDASAADSGNEEPVTSGTGDSADNGIDTSEPAAISTKPDGAPVKLSRREAQRQKNDDLAAKLDTLTKSFGDAQKTWETKLSQVEQENARSRGAFEAIVAQTRQQQIQQGQQTPRKSPDEMKRAAREALDAGKFDDWDRLNTEAILEQVKGLIPAQQPVQSGPHPVVQAMMAQYPAVLNAGQRGVDMAIAQDNVLAAMGVPDGPERYRKAFELASNTLGGQQQQQPQFSQASRGALAGVSGARNSGPTGAGDPGIMLSAYEKDVARRCGMSLEEYASFLAEAQPDRVKNA